MQTRFATVADAAAIASVHVRSWQGAYAGLLDASYLDTLSIEHRTLDWRAALRAKDSTTVVAESEGRVVAFVSYGACRDEGAPPDRGEIWALYALPEAWGTGAGQRLLDVALDTLSKAGKRDCSLWVLTGNARALAFYRRAGFQEVPASRNVVELGGRQVEEAQYRRLLVDGA